MPWSPCLAPEVAWKCPKRPFVSSGRQAGGGACCHMSGGRNTDEVLVSLPRAGLRPMLDQLSKKKKLSPVRS